MGGRQVARLRCNAEASSVVAVLIVKANERFMRLPDPWDRKGPLPLDGVLERGGFSPLLTALLTLGVAFVLFQVVISPLVIFGLLLAKGVGLSEMFSAFDTMLEEHPGVFLAANTVGQFLGLAVPAALLARWHSSRPQAFVRLRPPGWDLLVLSIVGLAGLIPVVMWLGTFNEQLPLPPWIEEFEQSQIEMLEKLLVQDMPVLVNLFVLALTPAICEELLFRGYVQRQVERGVGVVGGILFSGIAFGLYHLRLTQVVPLAILGLYLAYLVWRTGSLWPAIVVHFANNAFAVVFSAVVARSSEHSAADLEQMQVPGILVVSGLVLFAASVYLLHRSARAQLDPPPGHSEPVATSVERTSS